MTNSPATQEHLQTDTDAARDPRWVKAVSPWTNRARRPIVWSVTRVPATSETESSREETPDSIRTLPLAA